MALPTCECVKGLPIGEQLAAIYCATYTLAAGDVDGPYLLKSANLSDVDDAEASRENLGAGVNGVWPGALGGTGIANIGKTITLGGNLTTSGAFATTLTVTGVTDVTLPVTGTLATTSGVIIENSNDSYYIQGAFEQATNVFEVKDYTGFVRGGFDDDLDLFIRAGDSIDLVYCGGTRITDTTTTGNVDNDETLLQTMNIAGNSLVQDGNAICFSVAGTVAANDNLKTILIYFGSSLIFNFARPFWNAASWSIEGRIIRTSEFTQKCVVNFITSDTAGPPALCTVSTAAETLSGSVGLFITGQATDSNDIVKETFKAFWEY